MNIIILGLRSCSKTTLSANHHCFLIGDAEHVWLDSGVPNIEGRCYAKTEKLLYRLSKGLGKLLVGCRIYLLRVGRRWKRIYFDDEDEFAWRRDAAGLG